MGHPNAPDQPLFYMRPHCADGEIHLARVVGPTDPNFIGDPENDGSGWIFDWAFGYADEDPTQPRICLMRPGNEVPFAVLDGRDCDVFLQGLAMIAGVLSIMSRNPIAQELAANLVAGRTPAKSTDVANAVNAFLAAEGVKAPS